MTLPEKPTPVITCAPEAVLAANIPWNTSTIMIICPLCLCLLLMSSPSPSRPPCLHRLPYLLVSYRLLFLFLFFLLLWRQYLLWPFPSVRPQVLSLSALRL